MYATALSLVKGERVETEDYMAAKTTSASYKIPVVNSSYHEKCIAPSVKAIKEASARAGSNKTFTYGAYQNCNAVAKERIWSEYCQKEHKIAKSWKKDWQFITEFDYKGNPKPKKQLPTKASFYGKSSDVPHTTAKLFGSRVSSPGSNEISRLEMTSCHRKRRTDLAKYNTPSKTSSASIELFSFKNLIKQATF